MNDIITVRGIVATIPRHVVTDGGLAISSFRLASPSRRWDRASSGWVNGDTNWYTVTAFRSLAANMQGSVLKGDRVVVAGRLRVRSWERDDRSGVAVEIDADTIGHDLAWGTSAWRKTIRHTADESAHPGEDVAPDDRAAVHIEGAPLRGGADLADDVDDVPADAGTHDDHGVLRDAPVDRAGLDREREGRGADHGPVPAPAGSLLGTWDGRAEPTF